MSSSDNFKSDARVNGLSVSLEKGLPLNARYRSRSLSTDKLNTNNADRAAILEDIESHYVTDKFETPSCLVRNKIMQSNALGG